MKPLQIGLSFLGAFLSANAAVASSGFLDRFDLFEKGPCDLSLDWVMEGSSAELFAQANEAEKKGNHCKAAQIYLEIQRQYPESPEFRPSEYRLIVALFEGREYSAVIGFGEEYLLLHPRNPNAADVLFKIAEADYRRIPMNIDFDQSRAEQAQLNYYRLIKTYPKSPLVGVAKERLKYCYERLAAKEIRIGLYYQERGELHAAALRFQTVAMRFKNSLQVPEALYRLADIFTRLGQDRDAENVRGALRSSFPDSEWANKP